MILSLLRLLYLCSVLLLTAYAIGAGILLIAYFRHRRLSGLRRATDEPAAVSFPTICVQLPVYDEPMVIDRLIDAAARFEYPPDKLTIQVLDDSDDETTKRAAERVAAWAARGVNIEHIRREKRVGFKAGALAHGLTLTDAELIAVFDADFVPPRDFLQRAVGRLAADPKIGMVQTRWGHLNADENALTRAVALALDGHFVIEQTARSEAGWLMNFNGSGGVWRAQTIRDAGGWRSDTLTEDLDLSYRAQLAGWKLEYLPELVVPGEIPPELNLYRQQQARWAQGGTQVFARLILPVWLTPQLTIPQRLMATMHLAQYLIHVLIILLIILTPILILTHTLPKVNIGPLGIVGIFPPLIYAASQQALYQDWRRRMLRGFPVLVIVATGMAWCNARSAIFGLVRRGGEFRRTPKFGSEPHAMTPVRAPSFGWELLLCLYSAYGVWLAWHRAPALVAYFAIYCFAFGFMTLWLARDSIDARRQHQGV